MSSGIFNTHSSLGGRKQFSPLLTFDFCPVGGYLSRSRKVVTVTFNQSIHTITVRIFGSLQACMDRQGLPYVFKREIVREGMTAYDIACELRIPHEEIEGVFINGRVRNIYDLVFPGDRVAFFPRGTPGPYRVFLGIVRENVERTRREKQIRKE